MANFEKLITLLPEFYGGILEMNRLLDAEDVKLAELDDMVQRLYNETNISTASSTTVAWWEELLGVLVDDGDTIETRREKLMLVLSSSATFTTMDMYRLLNNVVGVGYWSTELVTEENTIRLFLDNGRSTVVKSVVRKIRRQLQVTMKLLVVYTGVEKWVDGNTADYGVRKWNYKLGAWYIDNVTPFTTVVVGSSGKVGKPVYTQKGFKTMADSMKSAIVGYKLSNSSVTPNLVASGTIGNLTTQPVVIADDTGATLLYEVPVDAVALGGYLSSIELLDSEGNVISKTIYNITLVEDTSVRVKLVW